MAPADFTPDQLRDAWLYCRRAAWPSTLEACMADPIISRIIMITAKHKGLTTQRPAPSQQRSRQALRGPTPSLPVFDRKRLASGEREDD